MNTGEAKIVTNNMMILIKALITIFINNVIHCTIPLSEVFEK